MSTVQETFTPDDNECPHGVEGVSESLIRCFYCWLEAEGDHMAIDDPRREA